MPALALVEIGEPGTIEDFQKEALRRWGFDAVEGLDIDRLSHEQATALHRCALYIEHVFREETGQVHPPGAVMCACLLFLLEEPARRETADRWVNEMVSVEPWEGKDDPERVRDALYLQVAEIVRAETSSTRGQPS
ncbi:MAG: hypothetical protein AAF637_17135 [Pseudomonadota bacterium]